MKKMCRYRTVSHGNVRTMAANVVTSHLETMESGQAAVRCTRRNGSAHTAERLRSMHGAGAQYPAEPTRGTREPTPSNPLRI